MLMAAGIGTRLRPFTDLEPKPLLPVMGIPMAQFALDSLARAGVELVVANVHHHAARAREGLLALERGPGMRIEVSDESAELLGSAGALRRAFPHFKGEPFFYANADVLGDVDLAALARQHARLRARHGVRITLALSVGPPGGKYREIIFDPESALIASLGTHQEGRPYFVGAAVIEPEAMALVPATGPSELVPLILEPAIRDGQAGVYLGSSVSHDIGSPALWLATHLELIRGLETGRLPAHWRKRIESVNRRVAAGMWASKKMRRQSRASVWAGPCYWDGLGGSFSSPRSLGPNAVVYGETDPDFRAQNGIGYKTIWAST